MPRADRDGDAEDGTGTSAANRRGEPGRSPIDDLDAALWDSEMGPTLPVLCKPAVAVPEHIITQAETLELARKLHADHPQNKLVLRLIENTGVNKRHLIRPIEETLNHTGFGHRNKVFEAEAKKRVPAVVDDALANAGSSTRTSARSCWCRAPAS